MVALRFVVLAVLLLNICHGEDLQVGTSVGNVLAYVENVKLSSIPLVTRTKNIFFNGNDTRTIKGISALDLERSNAKVTVTAGGVGFLFTNVKVKSDRGDGLNYQVQIFV